MLSISSTEFGCVATTITCSNRSGGGGGDVKQVKMKGLYQIIHLFGVVCMESYQFFDCGGTSSVLVIET